MRRPTFLRVYSSDATEKADEATPINRSDSDDVRNSIDNNDGTLRRAVRRRIGAPPVRRVRMVRCQIRPESVRGPGGSGAGVRRGLPESAEVRRSMARCDAAKPSSRKLRRYNILRRHNTSN